MRNIAEGSDHVFSAVDTPGIGALNTGVRHLLALGLVAACSTSPDAPESYAQFSPSATVRSSRAAPGVVSYGAPYHKWTITLATTEGCGGDNQASVEINTLSSVDTLMPGPIAIRTAETTINTLPSAYVRYMNAPVLSGTVTIDSFASDFITGSWTAMLMIGGVPTEVTASFGAPVCVN